MSLEPIMKKVSLLAGIVCVCSALADPGVPTAETVSAWAAFSAPVHLTAEKVDRGDFTKMGEAVWIYGYTAKKETLSAFVIGVYKAGTFLGTNRLQMEKVIAEQAEKMKALAERFKNMDKSMEELTKRMRIETRPDGRKVYFTVSGFGPGGAGYMAFTTLSGYDIMLEQLVNAEDDTPQEKKLKNPARPTKDLSEMFIQLERHIQAAK